MQSFYDSSTYLIFDASISINTALKAAEDYTIKRLVQQLCHLSLKNYFCADQNKKITGTPLKMVQKKTWKFHCDLEIWFDINNW